MLYLKPPPAPGQALLVNATPSPPQQPLDVDQWIR